jgi:Ser/Thr protein kinase RdoA (MazF antagonist)
MRSPEVNQVLNYYPPDCQPTHIESLGSAGGMSGAQFWRINSGRGILCLRRWPVEHPSPERLAFIHAFLQHAARGGISFTPVPVRTKAGESFVKDTVHLWQLEPWMPGTADYERAPHVEKLRAAMTALAQLHVATRDFASSAPGFAGGQNVIERRLARLHDAALNGQVEFLRAITDRIWPELAPLARQFLAVLPNAARPAIAMLEPLSDSQLPLQVCLRDVWHDHIRFTGDNVTGVIDFGAVDFDTPATDIARLLGSFVADDAHGWQAGLEAYLAVRSLSRDESLAVRALDKSGTILAGCNWIRWIYLERRTFDNQTQIIDRFRRLLERVSRIG